MVPTFILNFSGTVAQFRRVATNLLRCVETGTCCLVQQVNGRTKRRLLGTANRDFTRWALARGEPARYQHSGRTECFFDDTQIEVSGPSFERSAMNYEGHLALSWQVLLVGPFLADHVLGATSSTKESPASDQGGKDVSNRLPELLAANADLWPKSRSHLYTDNASSAGKYTLAGLAWNLLQARKLLRLPAEHAPKRMRTLLAASALDPGRVEAACAPAQGVSVCAGGRGADPFLGPLPAPQIGAGVPPVLVPWCQGPPLPAPPLRLTRG